MKITGCATRTCTSAWRNRRVEFFSHLLMTATDRRLLAAATARLRLTIIIQLRRVTCMSSGVYRDRAWRRVASFSTATARARPWKKKNRAVVSAGTRPRP